WSWSGRYGRAPDSARDRLRRYRSDSRPRRAAARFTPFGAPRIDGVTTVAGLVLAAGEGRRYGMPKALVPHHRRLFVESTVDRLRAAGCAGIYVVAGAAADRVRGTDLGDAEVVENPDWATGMGSSLRRGIEALRDEIAVAVMTVDLPGVTTEAIK